MAKETKTEKPVKTIDFATEIGSNKAVADLMSGATVDVEKRVAETDDIVATVETCRTQEAPFDQEFLAFSAKTSKGVDLIAGHEYFQRGSGDKAETAETCKTGLFNYALSLRQRSTVSNAMKVAAQGPEKTLNKALSSLEAVAAALPAEQAAAIQALLASLKAPAKTEAPAQ